jgi:integrase
MVERLKATAERPEHRAMQLSLNLLLYSGIRPTEVSRLRESDFCREEGIVIIRAQKSKTGGGRVVPLRGLSSLPTEAWRIPRNWQQRWRALRRAAGFAHWQADACRHTFASYHATHFRDLPALQLEMGHRDASLLRTRYISPAHRREAEMFWKAAH